MPNNLIPVPQSLKAIQPYIQRSLELERKAPLVAYFCRTYAAERGVGELKNDGHPNDGDAQKYLIQLMDMLEEDKARLDPNSDEGKVTITAMAVKIFKSAIQAEKAGQITAKTAKLFYVSSILFEVATQFGELDEEMVKLYQCGRYKAAEVKKSLRGGNMNEEDDMGQLQQEVSRPVPSSRMQNQPSQQRFPKQQQDDDDDFDKLQQQFLDLQNGFPQSKTSQSSSFQAPSNHSSFQNNQQSFQNNQQSFQNNQQSFQNNSRDENQFHQPKIHYQPPPSKFPTQMQDETPKKKSPRQKDTTFGGYKDDYVPPSTAVDQEDIDNATKYARYAISSLGFEDVPAAIENLKIALDFLQRQ